MVSNAYQPRERQDSIRLAIVSTSSTCVYSIIIAQNLYLLSACAINAERHDIVVEQCRKIITHNQFDDEPLRILMASLASGLRSTDAFITSTLQKHLFREMKLSDTAVKHPEVLKWNNINKRYAPTATGGGTSRKGGAADDDGEDGAEDDVDENDMIVDTPHPGDKGFGKDGRPQLPTKSNPVIITIYGQICIAAKSYQSAICTWAISSMVLPISDIEFWASVYLLHAYDYFPDDPMICLCLAIASVGRAMQRQSDNRHHLIIQVLLPCFFC